MHARTRVVRMCEALASLTGTKGRADEGEGGTLLSQDDTLASTVVSSGRGSGGCPLKTCEKLPREACTG